MIILALTLTAWALWYKYVRHKKRHTTTAYAAPIVSPAQIDRRRKAQETAQRSAERERIKAEKERAAREQAEIDIPYYETQLSRFYEMIEDARADLKIARRRIRTDAEMNRYGAVVPEKIVNKHITERDKLMEKAIKLENQIHAMETKLNKARNITAK